MDDSLSLYEDYRRRRSMPSEDLLSHGTVRPLLSGVAESINSIDPSSSMRRSFHPSTYDTAPQVSSDSRPSSPRATCSDPQQPSPSTLSGLGYDQTRYGLLIKPSALCSGVRQELASGLSSIPPPSSPLKPSYAVTNKNPLRGSGFAESVLVEDDDDMPPVGISAPITTSCPVLNASSFTSTISHHLRPRGARDQVLLRSSSPHSPLSPNYSMTTPPRSSPGPMSQSSGDTVPDWNDLGCPSPKTIPELMPDPQRDEWPLPPLSLYRSSRPRFESILEGGNSVVVDSGNGFSKRSLTVKPLEYYDSERAALRRRKDVGVYSSSLSSLLNKLSRSDAIRTRSDYPSARATGATPAAKGEIPVDKLRVIRSNDPTFASWAEGHDHSPVSTFAGAKDAMHASKKSWGVKKKAARRSGQAMAKQQEHPPASTSPHAEDSEAPQDKFPVKNPGSTVRPSRTESSTTRDYADGPWKPMPPIDQISSLAIEQNEGLTREIERVDLGAGHMSPPARPSHSSAGMFTNAQVNEISGGTFLNVAHVYECDSGSPAQGGGPAFPIAVLGLQAVSFATRSHYPHCSHQFDPLPLLIPEVTSTVNVALGFPLFYEEMRTIIGPLTLWLIIKMWIQRRTIERH